MLFLDMAYKHVAITWILDHDTTGAFSMPLCICYKTRSGNIMFALEKLTMTINEVNGHNR